ncbi:MAG: FHA domain-containing protein [Solirubrobacteraceae bacterium]
MSQSTLVHRLDLLFKSRLIDPSRLVGDLVRRAPRRAWHTAVADAIAALTRSLHPSAAVELTARPSLLALDWDGGQEELLLGREETCDVVLSDRCVSRRHARLIFRDGSWIICDLQSTNGTTVNNVRVGRCQLHPGDRVGLGAEQLVID